ncbi:IgA peptidase M64-domain-containing protein [Gorgonomyces haynaldii]|nr:IgA peptidase M64-domain-containing protein [Gorgonomyces haynaldii]
MHSLCDSVVLYASFAAAQDEVKSIIYSGAPENRIDVVFMGDGYTVQERDLFFSDISRLVNDMWSATTFAAVLPLFNVWAVYRPSVESGIGTGGKPRNTAFGLYRDGTELRGIYPSKPKDIREACKAVGAYACDYPSVIGNDPYYGGLGGEFVIGTSSETSGTIVLRHEMGHNLVNVGEEYDNGQVYDGVNSSPSLDDIKWTEWLTEDQIVEQKQITIVKDYAWTDLAKGPYKISFKSNGNYNRWMLKVSTSGFPDQGSLIVTLDGSRLDWNSTGNYDRSFTEWSSDKGLAAGWHELVFKEAYPAQVGKPIHQLCSVDMHEYAAEPEFHMDNSYIGAFPTYDIKGQVTYRPTNEGCLMRNMSQHEFCSVCKQGLWTNLLKRISLIDELKQDCNSTQIQAHLKTIQLGQFREKPVDGLEESLHCQWFQGNELKEELNDNFDPVLDAVAGEEWHVIVSLSSSQIRRDKKGVTQSRLDFVTCKQ